MGSFNRNDRPGGFRGGFNRGGGRGGFGGGRSPFRGRGGFDRGGDRGNREMFKTTCSNCGKECEVPFRPTNGKPVYCSDCFEKMGNGGRGDSSRNDFRSQASVSAPSSSQLETLNAKLDKIISLLEPKKVEEKKAVEKVIKEIKAPKTKKTVKKSAPVKE